jgi:paraquat-inducible protein B
VITVSFDNAEGLQSGQSQLKFKEIVLGTVQGLDLTPDHTRVLVRIATTRQAETLISDQTVFWVVKPRLFAGNISGLDTLLSGSYVGMLPPPTPGKPQTEFVGREDPPVLEANVPGHTFLLKASRIGSISLGSPVFYRDIEVGQVLGWEFAKNAESVTIRAFVRAPYDSDVHDETRFWNASGVSVKLGADGVQLQVESMRAILLGGIAFETPADAATADASLDQHGFPLFANRDAANAASYRQKIPLVSFFSGSVRGLEPGSEVTMHGLVVGHVTNVRLFYDPVKDKVLAPVRFDVEPERILGVGAKAVFKTPAEAVTAVVGRGLRASLQSSNLLTGQQAVSLDFDVNAPPATVTMDGQDFVLPTSEGAGFAGLAAAAATLLDKVNTIPFKQIGDNLDGILASANDAAKSPQMQQALTQLSQTLSGAKDLVAHLDNGMTPALKQLPDMATNLQKTMTNVNKLVSSLDSGYGDNTIFNRQVERLLMQLNDAVASIRSLVDMLDRHPEALIKGRPVGAVE